MQENQLFEALLDVIPFATYAVDVNTYEVVYANKMMHEKMYAPRESFCWKKVFGQEEVCSWCTIPQLKQRQKRYKSDKLVSNFFDESTDKWLQSYDELVKWPDGRDVKYTICVDISEQKEIQASMIKTHTKLAIQTKQLQIANEKLEFLATKDYLTGINNRGNFFKLTKDIWDIDFASDGLELYVVMMDIDHFKNLNDTYGHRIGDIALKEFTNAVLPQLNENDIFGRLGGEEFAIVTTDKNQENVINKLEKIRQNIENIVIIENGKNIKFTVSIGFAKKEDTETIDMTLEKADKMLYVAKTSGRNKLKFRTIKVDMQ
ncbi:GGDEF domain-containing protein [Arcobacter sp. FWKO B]|uniref:GGDEF domain-containing protein n=1 Tax=Arcobacter sp. FWKO B TaxID=2593672 RepID=UPI0018A61261|nr:GGDEF domain-containing protein [Arcobacter sp. FWKO B]QOG12895.1 GGDEF domain-containing protein [Arcobacter sp. FWKO B]